jgi:hypothetical protein
MRFIPLLIILVGLLPGVAGAATLYIDPNTTTLNRGDAITLAVRLDTDEAAEECVNAIDGVITYSESIVADDVSIGQSIFPVWVEAPTINKEKRTITFAGGIPNGYCGRVAGDPRLTNTVVELVFRSPGLQVGGGGADNTTARVEFAPETTAYLNDGLGTKASLATLGTTITLNPTIGGEIVDDWRTAVGADTVPPEAFSISLEQDQSIFENRYFIVFNTTDKQTGISHYEVIEESAKEASIFSFGAATAPWQEVRSPYEVRDQSLRSVIRVRAIDKAGNEYVATLVPELETVPWYKDPLRLALIGAGVATLLVVVLLAYIGIRGWRRRAKRRSESALVDDDAVVITSDE